MHGGPIAVRARRRCRCQRGPSAIRGCRRDWHRGTGGARVAMSEDVEDSFGPVLLQRPAFVGGHVVEGALRAHLQAAPTTRRQRHAARRERRHPGEGSVTHRHVPWRFRAFRRLWSIPEVEWTIRFRRRRASQTGRRSAPRPRRAGRQRSLLAARQFSVGQLTGRARDSSSARSAT